MIRREAAIVGIGQTEYAKALPPTAWELAVEAHAGAAVSAGLANIVVVYRALSQS